MGFYIRKSISVGPFRFNLSKGGVGVSVGVKGLRVGSGPRGNYVQMGGGGLYYRTTLSPHRSTSVRQQVPARGVAQAPRPLAADGLTPIESAPTHLIVDSSASELLEQINANHRKMRSWPWMTALTVVGLFYLQGPSFPPWLFQAVLITGLVLIAAAVMWDHIRKTTVLFYDLDPDAEQRFEELHRAFDGLRACNRAWRVAAQGSTHDQKRNAGATSLVRRSVARLYVGNPPRVKCNIAVPAIPVGSRTLFFFPDSVLVFDAASVGAVAYKQLRVSSGSTRFIESDPVPSDGLVVGSTWRFVNKDGGPDKRFNNNRQIPIVQYEQMDLSSDSGLNERLQLSRTGVGRPFYDACYRIGMHLAKLRSVP